MGKRVQPDSMQPDYSSFSARDFVLDDSFRQWVLSPDEATMSFWHTYMLQHPEQQEAIDEAASILLHLRTTYHDLGTASQERIWVVLSEAFDRQQARRSGRFLLNYPDNEPGFWQRSYRWMAASAATLLLVAGGYWYYAQQPHQVSVYTSFGKEQAVTLPDNSTVTLNGNSTLTYFDKWPERQTREVWLEGEGFFQVVKQAAPDGRVKFITHTPTLDITVLGTQFNVNTRRGNTDVMLVEGRVQLRRAGEVSSRTIEMKPGQLASARRGIAKVEVRAEKPQLHAAWVQHQFVFEGTSLRDIAQQLRDTYDIDLIFEDDALADRRFTGNLANQDVATLIETVAATFDLTAERDGKRVILRRVTGG